MPSTVRRPALALLLSACTLIAGAALGAPVGTAQPAPVRVAQPANCENRLSPPPPVDTSEQVPDGTKPPSPLPVPETPVGGERMAECGLVQSPNAKPAPDQVTAAGWVLADMDSGVVLAAKDPHGRQRPASVMKVLLAMVVAKELPLDTTVVATQEDVDQECTCVGLRDGGEYTVEQLMQALLMMSGNDVAHTLARRLGGVPSAVRKMTALAAELGALDTRAITPSGLDAPGTSTSAYDVAVIFRAAMKYPEFAKAISTPQISFPARSGRGTIQVVNDNLLLGNYEGALGGRAGFTDDALNTYVGAAERGGKRLVVALLRGTQEPVPIVDQAAALLDHGFELQGSEGVGKLVDGAPQPKKKTTEPKPTETSAAPGAPKGNSSAGNRLTAGKTPMEAAFGNVGLPITGVAALGVVLGLLMYLRTRRAKAARARRAAEQEAKLAQLGL
ncbi:D-alanyl-D-alanine carboxypeptidase family protein [Umezawaea sp.]|uniref:D-alanyl-D-alanine carboxypeptidase family protein n=1 Tax=Umezawaea sp. TaxID=1955258 RepID=UPI002ED69DC7